MKIWEERIIELMRNNVSELDILDTLQLEMKQEGIFAEEQLDKHRIDFAQQMINNIKG